MKKKKDTKEYMLKIICKTPPNRAEKDLITFKDVLTGFGGHKRIIAEEIIGHDKFIFIVLCVGQKELEYTIMKCAKAEVRIRKIYKVVIKVLDKLNKLAQKGGWGIDKTKRAMVRLMKERGIDEKTAKDWSNNAKVTRGTFEIKDKEQILELINGNIIRVGEL